MLLLRDAPSRDGRCEGNDDDVHGNNIENDHNHDSNDVVKITVNDNPGSVDEAGSMSMTTTSVSKLPPLVATFDRSRCCPLANVGGVIVVGDVVGGGAEAAAPDDRNDVDSTVDVTSRRRQQQQQQHSHGLRVEHGSITAVATTKTPTPTPSASSTHVGASDGNLDDVAAFRRGAEGRGGGDGRDESRNGGDCGASGCTRSCIINTCVDDVDATAARLQGRMREDRKKGLCG